MLTGLLSTSGDKVTWRLMATPAWGGFDLRYVPRGEANAALIAELRNQPPPFWTPSPPQRPRTPN
jgi:hypothetical protein